MATPQFEDLGGESSGFLRVPAEGGFVRPLYARVPLAARAAFAALALVAALEADRGREVLALLLTRRVRTEIEGLP